MTELMLQVENLHVEIAGREILHGVNLEVPAGETHALFGPNGSGKTSLLNTIMGLSGYKVTAGRILFEGEDITALPTDERARRGIGIAFQRPPTIHGVRTRDMVRIAGRDEVDVEPLAGRLNLLDHLDRDVNDGFSGGEIKRSEMLQLLAQRPKLVLLDEPESGVDLENIVLIGDVVGELLQKDQRHRLRTRSGLIITHTGFMLDYVNAEAGHVLCGGTMMCKGDAREILRDIRAMGYEECVGCRRPMR